MSTSRRTFFKTVGGGTVALGFGGGCNPDDGPEDGRVVQETLVVDWLRTTMGGLDVRLRSYNGAVPGSTIVVRPGDRLEVTIDNRLSAYDSSAWTHNHNVPHDLNTTNLHLHGMDVIPHLFEPVGTSDATAAMIAIAPGETYHYTFDIPADQPSGMFWYHPHHHGSTAVQAVSGMAGVVIVEGPIDEVPEIAAARDLRLVLSDIGLFESEDEEGVWTYEPVQNAIWNTSAPMDGQAPVRIWNASEKEWVDHPELHGGFTTGDYAVRFYCANGTPFYREDHAAEGGNHPSGHPLSPMLIEMQPGEVIRLRVLNACSDLVMPLALEGLDLHLIAMDGVNFAAPRTMTTAEPADDPPGTPTSWDGTVDYSANATSLVLAPANRAEMLIKAGAPGTYELVQLYHTEQQFLTADRKVIATIVVAGEALEMDLPSTLPTPTRYLPRISASEIVGQRTINFTGNFPGTLNPTVGIDFSLNDVQYAEQTINETVALGSSEEWVLGAAVHDGHNSEGHPFHIHVNSFEVKEINGKPQPAGTLMDTLWIPPNQSCTVWMRFKEWVGKAVYHCHILPHEDTGMMGNLMIEDEK